MKLSTADQPNSPKSIDQSLIRSVMETYAGCKASGHGEVAARNAAVTALREAMPNWNLRAASEMVNEIIAGSEPAGQTAA